MPDFSELTVYLPLFFLVAALYSSVGHGGASGYLALFAFLGMAAPNVAPIALVLNVFVAGLSFYNYSRAGFFPLRLFLAFALTSIPFAFLGGMVHPSVRVYQIFLGISLLFAAGRMLFLKTLQPNQNSAIPKKIWMYGASIGCILGFVSGMVGVGGGIFLSPILLLSRWADVKRTAGVSSAFIVVNSLAGLLGHYLRGNIHLGSFLPLLLTVIVGGMTGSFLGARRASEHWLQKVLGIVLLLASIKLLGI